MTIKAVAFDFDGTLADTTRLILEGCAYAVAPWNITVNQDVIELIRTQSSHDLFEPILGKEEAKEALKRLGHFTQENMHRLQLFGGITETLQRLQAMGLKLAVWTGRDAGSVMKLLTISQIKSFFHPIIASCHVKKNKPHSEGLLSVCHQLQVKPEELVMVGDHSHDIVPAKEIGARFLGAGWNEGLNLAGYQESADLICGSPEAIVDWCASMNGCHCRDMVEDRNGKGCCCG